MDQDYYNTLYAENRQEAKEVNEKKNIILRMTKTKKKQAEWNKLYPKVAASNIPY